MESIYFAPLDRCLAGEEQLISWKTLYRSICDEDSAKENTLVEAFVTDATSQQILLNPLSPFPPPTEKSKNDFTTKTAPINVSQSPNAKYNLSELKDDAIWLSSMVKMEEVAALRVVVLEWQQRSHDQLLLGCKTSESVGGVPKELGLRDSKRGTTLDLGKEAIRRDRQLEIFLEEKNYILRLHALLLCREAAHICAPKIEQSWIDVAAAKILPLNASTDDTQRLEKSIEDCIGALESRLMELDDPSKRPEVCGSTASRQLMHATAIFQDVITTARIILAKITGFQGILGVKIVQTWFRLMSKYNFLQDLAPSSALPDPSVLQCLLSVVSLALLQLPENMAKMQDAAAPMFQGSLYPVLSDSSWLSHDACVKELNEIMYRAALSSSSVASPAIYAWGILTTFIRDVAKALQESRDHQHLDEGSSDAESPSRRRSSIRDSRTSYSVFETSFTLLQDIAFENDLRDDPPSFFVRTAVDQLQVYRMMSALSVMSTSSFGSDAEVATAYLCRRNLLELLHQSVHGVNYGAEILEALLSILSPEVAGASQRPEGPLAARFATDSEVFRLHFVEQAIARYPFELSPMLQLFTALTSARRDRHTGSLSPLQILEHLPTMTIMMHENFNAYALDHEDENTNSMVLTNALPLFVNRQWYNTYGFATAARRSITQHGKDNQDSGIFAVRAGTSGTVVRETRPMVFKLDHQHSAPEYLGLLLSTLLPNSDFVAVHHADGLDRATAADIILLLTGIIKASLQHENDFDEARFVLGRFAFALPDQEDIISVISDILENELLSHTNQSVQEGSLEVLVACVKFLEQLLLLCPERVWALLSRSSLLGINEGANALAAAVGGTEVQTGSFRFLAECISLHSCLLEDAVSGIVRRKSKPGKSANRFEKPVASQNFTPERTMGIVLRAYQTVVLDVLQNLADWRFTSAVDKYNITSLIVESFQTSLLVSQGVDLSKVADNKLTEMLHESSQGLLDSLAPQAASLTLLEKFAPVLSAGIAVADDLLPTQERASLVRLSTSTLKFLATFIRTVRLVDGSARRVFLIGKTLLKNMPVLAGLLAADHAFKEDLCALFAEIVLAINDHEDAETPSLLGQLSSDIARAFLQVVCMLDRPLRDVKVESSMWKFLSAVLASKQQWFAIFLLTGSLPKDRLNDNDKGSLVPHSKSLLAYALDQLSNLTVLAPERAISMLAFVGAAQNAWIWATNEVSSHTEFLKNSMDWLEKLQVRTPNAGQELILANEHLMAAHLCDIYAVNLHASLEVGDKVLLKMIVPKLSFLREHGVCVDSYNRSLHRNLADNFSRKFSGCAVQEYKRTAANPGSFGLDYVYDLEIATKILRHEVAWQGALTGRNQGFVDEFARANINLSLVEAQTRLLRSWNILATTLCECAEQDLALPSHLAQTALKCLTTNMTANPDEPDVEQIVRTRTELAFVIISKLVAVKATAPELKNLLAAAWDLVRASPVDYDVATTVQGIQYYRTLLQVLYLTIQPHIYLEPSPQDSTRQAKATDETKQVIADTATNGRLIEIVANVISPGFRALCGNLHSDSALALPSDFSLLTALLQSILAVPGISAVHTQLAEVIASTSVVRGALSLFSWADQLAEVMHHDPVYGEVTIMLLLALSTVRPIAEQIALDGALAQLSSANLHNYFRKPGGKGPFDQPQRMFNIWAERILPLCLNLLDAVGAPIAGEVVTFLNSFPEQLARAQTALENREPSVHHPHAGAVTLSLVSEAHSLCLIAVILSSDTARGAAEGIDAADVPRLDFDHLKVKEDAAALARQRTSLAARVVPVGEREADWATREVSGPSDNLLQAKVIQELTGLRACFGES